MHQAERVLTDLETPVSLRTTLSRGAALQLTAAVHRTTNIRTVVFHLALPDEVGTVAVQPERVAEAAQEDDTWDLEVVT